MLTNTCSSFSHSPERKSCATMPAIERARSRWANCWLAGATNSPSRNVITASTAPSRSSIPVARATETPAARITVYSEFATNCASANSVPMRTAMGNTS